MRGIVVFALVTAIVVSGGIVLQNSVARLTDGCVVLLEKAEIACREEKFDIAEAYAEEFSRMWSSSEELVALFSKRDNYEEISETAMRLVPLIQEQNYSEFRSDCRTTVNFLKLLRRYEVLSWQGIL